MGALLRIKSQRTLGPLFTWEVSIRPSHKLITSGPYAFVRHPSYTGSILFLIGEVIFATSHGTLLSECVGYYPRVAFYGGLFCLLGMSMGAVTMINRTVSEDQVLRKEFGKEWDEWSTKVKYRLVPGVF
jgi:protein-S-isoprenylcysteine O-methyltransferase Ste14